MTPSTKFQSPFLIITPPPVLSFLSNIPRCDTHTNSTKAEREPRIKIFVEYVYHPFVIDGESNNGVLHRNYLPSPNILIRNEVSSSGLLEPYGGFLTEHGTIAVGLEGSVQKTVMGARHVPLIIITINGVPAVTRSYIGYEWNSWKMVINKLNLFFPETSMFSFFIFLI